MDKTNKPVPRCGRCAQHPPCDDGKACCTCPKKNCNGRQTCADEPVEVLPPQRGPGRPPKYMEIVETRTLPQRAKKIGEYHKAAMTAAAYTAVYAVLCGLELLAARAQVRHGNWDTWVEDNCPFNRVTAWRYMQAAERKAKDLPNVYGRKHLLDTPPHLLPEKDRAELITAVTDAVDQQSWTELQLDLGLRTPEKPKGGAREGAGRPTKTEAERSKQAGATGECDELERELSRFVLGKTWQYLDDPRRVRFCDALRGALKLIGS
jgi:hypothetical protein